MIAGLGEADLARLRRCGHRRRSPRRAALEPLRRRPGGRPRQPLLAPPRSTRRPARAGRRGRAWRRSSRPGPRPGRAAGAAGSLGAGSPPCPRPSARSARWSSCAARSPPSSATTRRRGRPRPRLPGAGLRLARRGRAAQPPRRRHRAAPRRRRSSSTTPPPPRWPRHLLARGARGRGGGPRGAVARRRLRGADRDRRHGLPLPRRRLLARGAVGAGARRARRDRRLPRRSRLGPGAPL